MIAAQGQLSQTDPDGTDISLIPSQGRYVEDTMAIRKSDASRECRQNGQIRCIPAQATAEGSGEAKDLWVDCLYTVLTRQVDRDEHYLPGGDDYSSRERAAARMDKLLHRVGFGHIANAGDSI
jgi:hypothetical protein